MSKGITFANMRIHVKTDQNMDMIYPSLFLHNGTDVDRLGENILGRELSSGKHDVSQSVIKVQTFILGLFIYIPSYIYH